MWVNDVVDWWHAQGYISASYLVSVGEDPEVEEKWPWEIIYNSNIN